MNQLSQISNDQEQGFAEWCGSCVVPAPRKTLLMQAAHIDHLSWMRGLEGCIEDFELFQALFFQEAKDAFPHAVKQMDKSGQISFKGLCLVAPAGCYSGAAL